MLTLEPELSKAVEGKVDKPQDSTRIIRKIKLERAKRELAEAHLIAERRSGARGATARRALNAQEDAVAATQARYVVSISLVLLLIRIVSRT